MTYAIKYHPEVIDDFQQLGGNVRKQVFKKIEQLAQNPQLGHSLGNKAGFDLTGYRKAGSDAMWVIRKRLLVPTRRRGNVGTATLARPHGIPLLLRGNAGYHPHCITTGNLAP
jgi:hypothetical protein